MSLRARLLVAMLALVTAGLLVADAATYRFLSSFLTDRVDQQLEVVWRAAARELTAPAPPGGDQDAPHEGLDLFPVTYAGVLDASGGVVAERSFGYGQLDAAPPELPAGLPGSSTGGTEVTTMTVGARDGDLTFRLRAQPLAGGGTFVVAAPLGDVADTLGRLLMIELIVSLAVLGCLAAMAWWLVRLGLRPLERMGETAGAIAAGDLSRRVEPANARTEVGRLGLALNAMLARIEESFAVRRASEERLRRFAADASHELRTPLTSVRGYAELFRRGAADDPEALANAMRRIEEESTRMADLVDELGLLARLDQRRPLEREPVDLAELASAAVEAARVADPSRPIRLEAPEPVVVTGDEARLRQVADNLLSNARVHTPAGSPVHVRVRAEGGEAVLEVEDEGPGHPGRGRRAGLRALLPRGPVAVADERRDRPGAVDRRGRRAGARRRGRGRGGALRRGEVRGPPPAAGDGGRGAGRRRGSGRAPGVARRPSSDR